MMSLREFETWSSVTGNAIIVHSGKLCGIVRGGR